jgi:protein-arginine kinase activator protein McsA
MKCNLCDKEDATLHLTENLGNLMVRIDLCKTCADRIGVSATTGFSMESVLATLEKKGGDVQCP